MPLTDRGLLWGFQLWINNPASYKMSDPFYHSFPAKRRTVSEGVVLYDLVGDVMRKKGFYPLTYLHIQMDAGRTFRIDLPEENATFLAVSEGTVVLNGEKIGGGHLAVPDSSGITIRSVSRSHILLGSAKPLGEPIVRWGPFVMTSEEEIRKAVEDFRTGKFT
ncbi:MAG: pirin-like C-terminal cupin domain-containing protein [Aquificota bacterium]|nr:pirin-like C-terminal cupin domain-containing protein [Aquificota bacterium]